MATLLVEYETSEDGSAQRLAAFNALRQRFADLDFPTRSEPRETFIAEISERWSDAPGAVLEEVKCFVSARAETMDNEQLALCLEVLADSGVILSESELFSVLNVVSSAPPSLEAEGAYRALVLLAGANWRAVLSFLERLNSQGDVEHPRALQAGLESIATYAPSQLGAVLVQLAPQLERMDFVTLRHISRELKTRAAPYVSALALLELDPERSRRFLMANFDGEDSPFGFETEPVEKPDDQILAISDCGQPIPLSDERTGVDVQLWIATVRTVTRLRSGERLPWSTSTAIIFGSANASPSESPRETAARAFFGQFVRVIQ